MRGRGGEGITHMYRLHLYRGYAMWRPPIHSIVHWTSCMLWYKQQCPVSLYSACTGVYVVLWCRRCALKLVPLRLR